MLVNNGNNHTPTSFFTVETCNRSRNWWRGGLSTRPRLKKHLFTKHQMSASETIALAKASAAHFDNTIDQGGIHTTRHHCPVGTCRQSANGTMGGPSNQYTLNYHLRTQHKTSLSKLKNLNKASMSPTTDENENCCGHVVAVMWLRSCGCGHVRGVRI